MFNLNKRICIFGAGGQGKEVIFYLKDIFFKLHKIENIEQYVCFMVDDSYFEKDKLYGFDVIKLSDFKKELYEVIIAIGDLQIRKATVDKLPKETIFKTIIHPNAIICGSVKIGEGSIITPGVILTTNIEIGKHAHLNLNTTITHDCTIGDYFTTGPGVNISGNCNIGNNVYIGTNAAIRQKITICDDVTIGMSAAVVKNINEKGIYVGIPAKKIENAKDI